MKRNILLIMLILGTVSLVSAQAWNFGPGRNFNNPRQPDRRTQESVPRLSAEKISVTGELTIVRGAIAVKSGENVYVPVGLNRYIGFIDSLKDGARVTLEGRTVNLPANENTKMILVTKLTVGGKDYDLERPWMTAPERSAEKQPQNPQARPQPERPRQPAPNPPGFRWR